MSESSLILALPKGRILTEVLPVLHSVGIEPEAAFADEDARQLRFATNVRGLDLIRVRSFDVATFVALARRTLGSLAMTSLWNSTIPKSTRLLTSTLGIAGCQSVSRLICRQRMIPAAGVMFVWPPSIRG